MSNACLNNAVLFDVPGSMSTSFHVVGTQTKGLFKRAICESGFGINIPKTPQQALVTLQGVVLKNLGRRWGKESKALKNSIASICIY